MSDKAAIAQFLIAALERKRGPVPGADAAQQERYRYLDGGHVDSFGLLHFIMEIEAEYGITLTAEDTQSDEFRWIGGLAGLIAGKLG